MVPFDAAALLAMLLAFYPTVSPAALGQARRERPEYFAGGALTGSRGDKLTLADGRIFDLIFDVDNPTTRHWQALDVTHQAGAPDPFPLEAGPLAPLDPAALAFPLPREAFVDLIAQELDGLDGQHARIAAGYTTMLDASDARPFDVAASGAFGDAVTAHGAHSAGFDAADPVDVITASDGHSAAATGARSGYDESPPPEQVVHDPGAPPGRDGGEHPKV